MNTLHNDPINDDNFVPKEGQRGLLCSNKKSFRCPSFGIKNDNPNEDVAIDYLASILVEAFLIKKNYEHNKKCEHKKSSNILQSIN